MIRFTRIFEEKSESRYTYETALMNGISFSESKQDTEERLRNDGIQLPANRCHLNLIEVHQYAPCHGLCALTVVLRCREHSEHSAQSWDKIESGSDNRED